jgi:hypothetical protein
MAEAVYGRGKSFGLTARTAIVVGSMVGSGFYRAPSAMAPFGLLAILDRVATGAGAVCLGLPFARRARLAPVTGNDQRLMPRLIPTEAAERVET